MFTRSPDRHTTVGASHCPKTRRIEGGRGRRRPGRRVTTSRPQERRRAKKRTTGGAPPAPAYERPCWPVSRSLALASARSANATCSAARFSATSACRNSRCHPCSEPPESERLRARFLRLGIGPPPVALVAHHGVPRPQPDRRNVPNVPPTDDADPPPRRVAPSHSGPPSVQSTNLSTPQRTTVARLHSPVESDRATIRPKQPHRGASTPPRTDSLRSTPKKT